MKPVPTTLFSTVLACLTIISGEAFAQRATQSDSSPGERPADNRGGRRGARTAESSNADYSGRSNVIARIKDEGLNRSEVMKTLSYLTDVIGPRLTGSPNLKRANEWTKDRLTSWGLTNAHL